MNQFFDDEHMVQLRQGPLSPYLDLFVDQLTGEGYLRSTARSQICAIAEFSLWLQRKRVQAKEITNEHCDRFLKHLRKSRYLRTSDPAAMKRILIVLRQEGVVPSATAPKELTPAECIRDMFVTYLREERGLADSTAFHYQGFVLDFLTERFSDGEILFSELSAADVVAFVRRRARTLGLKRTKLMTGAIKSFLRFAQYRGLLEVDIATTVPKVINWSRADIPKALPIEDVARALATCNRTNNRGRRDYAMLLLLSQLGLRAGELVSLTLDDIDWDLGCILIKGKGNERSKLPLPAQVGEALADYLKNGRPNTTSRALFFTVKAPIVAIARQEVVGHMVARVLTKAGIDTPQKGAHRLRHTLATEMLRQGASLAEIGEILRHRCQQSTMIYAKVDLLSLKKLAQAWPGGEQ